MIHASLQRAQLLYTQGRFDLAADAVRESLSLSPQDAYAHALLGLCLLNQKNYSDAAAEAELAVVSDPDMAFAHYARGTISQERNYFAQAETAAREALRLAPEDADYWALLSQSLLSLERPQESLDAADKGLEFDSEHLGCINLRAVTLVKLGRKEAAAASITGALQRNPHNALTHANQGWTLLHQNNPRQALEHFREALRLDPNNQWARDGTIAALKAHHLLYRIMLRYYLWMSRFSSRGQWGIIIGLWIAVQIMLAINQRRPELAPFLYPLIAGYVLFVFAGWLCDPIFNLALLVSPFGRHLLTLPQSLGAVAVAILLLMAAGCALAFLALSAVVSTFFFVVGATCLFLTLPTAAAAKCRITSHIALMTGYTIAVAMVAAVALLLGNASLFGIVAWACVLSSLASNVLLSIIPKK